MSRRSNQFKAEPWSLIRSLGLGDCDAERLIALSASLGYGQLNFVEFLVDLYLSTPKPAPPAQEDKISISQARIRWAIFGLFHPELNPDPLGDQ